MVQMFSSLDPMNHVWRPLLRQMDEMFDVLCAPVDHKALFSGSVMRFDVQETEDLYVLNFDVPGVQREDLCIELVGNRLQIRGERKYETNGDQRAVTFHQYIDLPDGVQTEHIAADLKDGVLRLAIQKPASVKPVKIKIGDGTAKGFLKNLLVTDKKIEVKKATPETVGVMVG